MAAAINILIVEDSQDDADMVLAELRRSGFDPKWKRVETEPDFLAEMKKLPDIILSDYSMPGFSGLRAAELLQASGLDVPFILVSGTVGEDVAVEAMKHGATDYLLKDRIVRLGSAVKSALREAHAQKVRKAAEAELRWKTALLQAQLDSSIDGILVVDSQGKKVLQNQRMIDLWKIPPQIAEDKNDAVQFEFCARRTKNRQQFAERVVHLYSHPDEISQDEIDLIDGTILDRYSAPVRDQAGNHYGRIWSFRDITERKRAEQRLNLLDTCVSNLNEIILVTEAEPIDEPGPKIVYVNDAFERITGYTAAEAIGRSPRFLQGEKTDQKVLAELRAALQRREPIKRQVINYKKDGAAYWMDINIVPIFDAAGKCTHFAAIERDITEQKKSEAQLQWKTAFFEAQVNSALDAIIVVDNEGKKLIENPQMLALWNHPKEILEETDHRRRLEWVTSLIKKPRQFAEKVEHLYAHPDEVSRDELELHDSRIFDRYTAPVCGQDGKVFGRIWTYRDVTGKKRIEARFRRLVDSNAQGVIFWNTKGQITQANDSFLKLMGYTRADLAAGPIDWFAMTPLKYASLDQRALKQIADTGVCVPFEKEYIRKDGQLVSVLIGAAAFEDSPEEGVCFVLDLTERKLLEQQFRQSQKMEGIGTLAGGVAHDFNNILAVIQMQAELLKGGGGLSAEQIKFADEIGATVQRAAALTRQLLLFSRKETMQLRDLDLNQSINSMANMLRRILGEDIEMQFKFSAQPLFINADAGMIDQVLLNLAVNSRDAMPKGGRLVIETSAVDFDETASAQSVQARPGAFACLSVSDNGCGIPPENLARIFEPFFTTKEVGKGTGLGLATLFGIVQQHQGWVNVYSEVGQGTTFRIYLPRLACSSPQKRDQPAAATLRGGHETILIVEDDNFLRPVVTKTLEQFGYRVLTASNGVDALEVWQQHRDEIRLLLTDLVMPGGMNGKELGERLLAKNPKLKVIYASGYSAEIVSQDFSLQEGVNFLTKPFQAQKLAKTIRNRLDQD